MQKTVVYVSLYLLFSVTSRGGEFVPSRDATEAMNVITPSSLLSHVRFLSDDLLEGRSPGTRGDVLARTYIATQMEMLGLDPGAPDGSYFQRVPIVSMTADPSTKLTIRGTGKVWTSPIGQISSALREFNNRSLNSTTPKWCSSAMVLWRRSRDGMTTKGWMCVERSS